MIAGLFVAGWVSAATLAMIGAFPADAARAASTGGGATANAASGGAEADRSPNGGALFGAAVPRPAARPVVRWLSASPRTVVAGGALPRLRFRVAQRGIERVQARIVVLRLPRRAPVARMSLSWVKTGRAITARWPAAIALRQGRYLVRLHVKDSRGHTLRRSARRPGRALVRVRAAPAPAVATPAPFVIAPPSAALPAPAASPGGPGVFPVTGAFDFGGIGGRFGAGRPDHIHEGQDIIAASGTPVVAPYGGTVASTRFQASGAGEYVVLDAVDGRDYFFAHCRRRSTVVAEGAVVAPGTPLCQVGATGTSSGPHLHFEIWNVGWRVVGGHPIDPLPELLAWAPK